MSRTLVIGDIHGGLRALQQVIERAAISHSDQLIFVGDYVDGWSESGELILFLSQLAEKQPCIFIRGNHDEWYEQWLQTGQASPVWVSHGGLATIKSYERLTSEEKIIQLQFLRQTKTFFIDDKSRCYLHAGFTSKKGPAAEKDPLVLAMDRSLWMDALSLKRQAIPEKSWPSRFKLFPQTFLGHTPTLNFNETTPMHAANIWNIDTGAAFTGPVDHS